jgi:hypothetical protein
MTAGLFYTGMLHAPARSTINTGGRVLEHDEQTVAR